MFLIIEDELGLVSTMMHEAAGGLGLLNTLESALSMLEKNERKRRAKSPAFQKWKGTSCPKICVMTTGRRESNYISNSHLLIAAANLYPS